MLLFTSVITSLSVPVKYTYTGQRCMCDFRGVLYTPLLSRQSRGHQTTFLHAISTSLDIALQFSIYCMFPKLISLQDFLSNLPIRLPGCPQSHGSTVNRPTVRFPTVTRFHGQPSNRPTGSTVNRPTVQPYGCPRSHGSTVNRPTVRSPTVTRFHGQPSNRPTVSSPTVTRFHGHG